MEDGNGVLLLQFIGKPFMAINLFPKKRHQNKSAQHSDSPRYACRSAKKNDLI